MIIATIRPRTYFTVLVFLCKLKKQKLCFPFNVQDMFTALLHVNLEVCRHFAALFCVVWTRSFLAFDGPCHTRSVFFLQMKSCHVYTQ